jgi:hypothetical protein
LLCRNQLYSGYALSPEDGGQAITGKAIPRQGPDNEKIASVPCGGVDQPARLFDDILFAVTSGAPTFEGYSGLARSEAAPARYNELEQTGRLFLYVFVISGLGRPDFESGNVMCFE